MEKKPLPLTISDLGRMGGFARAAKLTKERRSAIAKKAAKTRWVQWRKRRRMLAMNMAIAAEHVLKGLPAKSRWKKAAKIAIVLLSLAAPLSAQEKSIRDTSLHIAPFMVIAAGQSADVLMTMKNFQAGCTEANTGAFGSSRPTTARLIGVKAAGMLPAVIITAFLQKSGHQKAANIIGGLVGGIGFAAAGYNLTVRCGR